ncbi:glycosyltransferase [Kosakonia sp. BYX6]|uniref:Glycosyltransferase n=1 Tax=Kosakonia calanthes TaxID=3139408 RepID=A0ABZ3B6X0_9ENTR
MDSFPEIKITEFKSYDHSDKEITDALNIAYGIDRNYLDWVGVSITSIVINNDINIEYRIISDEYNECFLERIAILAKRYSIKITLYLINAECLSDLPSTKIWSRAMYFRLFAFEHFSNKLDKLLYLDADVFCKGRLDELANCELNNVAAAVVRDVDSMQNKAAERLKDTGLKDKYFNSGVVFANLQEWVKNDLTKRTFSILLSEDSYGVRYKYPDQDVLNILLKDNVIFMPRKFNTIYTIKSELKDRTHQQYKKIILDETVLIHYTGATKPWHKWATYPSTIYYQKALAASPWKDQPPRDARTFIEFKKRYKHLLIQHNYCAGLVAGFQYLLRKYSIYQK